MTVLAPGIKPGDFHVELEQINQDISQLAASLQNVPADAEKRTRLVYRLYHRASLTGDLNELKGVETAIDDAIRRWGPKEDLCLLKANLDFKLHRLADARHDLELAAALLSRAEGKALLADLDFQEGRYEKARAGYESLIQEHRTWDNLARLAYFRGKMGDVAGADLLYAEAEDELTAKEMRSYAWLELQRGVLDLTHGRHEEARDHYMRAGRAYSGYWHIEEHIAELLAAEERYGEAVALYENVISRVRKPELQQTLGELYAFLGESEKAQPWYEEALAAYLQSAERGEVHYYHHLTDFYADVREDGAEAVKWARKDIALRENLSTQAALAWALHRDGQHREALSSIDRALSSGVKDADMFAQAAAINGAAGRAEAARQFLQLAEEVNPHYRSFHVHR